MNKNTQYLVAILALLAFLRFFVQPFFQSQNEALAQHDKYQAQIERAQTVIEHKEQLLAARIAAEETLQRVAQQFGRYKDSSQFRFQFQKQLEQLAKDNGVRVTRADWRQSNDETITTNLKRAEFVMFVRGHAIDVVNLLRKLDELNAVVKAEAMRLNIETYNNEPMEVIEGPVTLTIYYLTQRDGDANVTEPAGGRD